MHLTHWCIPCRLFEVLSELHCPYWPVPVHAVAHFICICNALCAAMNCLKWNPNVQKHHIWVDRKIKYTAEHLSCSIQLKKCQKFNVITAYHEIFHFRSTGISQSFPNGVLAWVLGQRGRHENVKFILNVSGICVTGAWLLISII